ncbi:MAG TPA: hypothetical protein VII56_01410 [Rhizomicrobium sp.]
MANSPNESTSPDSGRVDRPRGGGECGASRGQEGFMVRDLQIMLVGLVFLFLGAIVVGVF